MKKIGVIGAMEIEVEVMKKILKNGRITHTATVDFYEGDLGEKEVVVARSGVGKVNAAICAQIMIDRFGVEALINTGVAGSLNNDINICDIVLSTDVVQHDVNATVFGYAKGQIPQMKELSFRADPELADLAEKVCREVNPGIQVFRGRIASGDQFISDDMKKAEIRHDFGADACEMEGAAIGQTAFVNGVPFLIIRSISDKADGSVEMTYSSFEELAARHSVNLTLELIDRL